MDVRSYFTFQSVDPIDPKMIATYEQWPKLRQESCQYIETSGVSLNVPILNQQSGGVIAESFGHRHSSLQRRDRVCRLAG